MVVSLAGTLNLKFMDLEGRDQIIKIQLPDYILANFIQVADKPRVALISGNMMLYDDKNRLKSVIIINGLQKVSSFFSLSTSYEPNLTGENLIDGVIYKQAVNGGSKVKLPTVLEDLELLTDDM